MSKNQKCLSVSGKKMGLRMNKRVGFHEGTGDGLPVRGRQYGGQAGMSSFGGSVVSVVMTAC